ncbi:alpha/beta hydrolase-fold protein [Marivirga arenosa]|uniref:Alpha/beta hydrolase-fold protein n=1 Tax=Marivirga arenosa TaxID=3059076 RepID=A0AA51ZY61_9BACT|nr:alpha/beta hydrolase-fold protein [Marivirga sp. BKB1-2]WNB18867.1 alpha/beta hydrolase-fold protein [Marivirga sp. BKB1-2]
MNTSSLKNYLKIKLFILLCCFSVLTPCKGQETNSITLGIKKKVKSVYLNEEKEYWINLPASYEDQGAAYKKYPLLILLDGHLHFQSATGMVNYMSAGLNGNLQIPEMVVVGIRSSKRQRDFTPDKIITTRPNETGGAGIFLQFLENELIPLIDQEYRTAPYRILFGHSLGGLFATHAYLQAESKFHAFLAIDPSFGTWDAETMDKKINAVTEKTFDRFIYIATANWGKRNIRNRDRHIRFYETLKSRSLGPFLGTYQYFDNENHASVPPIAFYEGISCLFEGYDVNYRHVESAESLKAHFATLSKRLHYPFSPPEALVNRIGYHLLQNSKDQTAGLAFFILNTELYPTSANAFDSLAEAYARLGENDLAISYYQKALKLNPESSHAFEMLKKLKSTN